jgi:hypothetical protein
MLAQLDHTPIHADRCPTCGARLALARREPHPTRKLPVEIRTYECVRCGEVLVKTIEDAAPRPERISRRE